MIRLVIDGKAVTDMDALHDLFARELDLPEWYGRNLDALYDILTGLEHRGSRFAMTMPGEDAPHEVRLYAQRIRDTFLDAGTELVSR